MNRKHAQWVAQLTEKIVASRYFLVIGTKNYLEEMENRKGEAYIQATIARKYNKPVILLLDTNMTKVDKLKLENHFSAYNVVKELEFDINSDLDQIVKEVAAVCKGEDDKRQ